jgi:hypothetical protein
MWIRISLRKTKLLLKLLRSMVINNEHIFRWTTHRNVCFIQIKHSCENTKAYWLWKVGCNNTQSFFIKFNDWKFCVLCTTSKINSCIPIRKFPEPTGWVNNIGIISLLHVHVCDVMHWHVYTPLHVHVCDYALWHVYALLHVHVCDFMHRYTCMFVTLCTATRAYLWHVYAVTRACLWLYALWHVHICDYALLHVHVCDVMRCDTSMFATNGLYLQFSRLLWERKSITSMRYINKICYNK